MSCFRRVGDVAVTVKGAEDAAILRLRLQERTAALALVKELAGVVGIVFGQRWPHNGQVIVETSFIGAAEAA